MARGKYVSVGTPPKLPVLDDSQNTIIYWSGSPERNLAKQILVNVEANGLKFRRMSSFGKVVGSIELFAAGKIAGVYYENMNVYDGCAEYAIPSGRGQPLYSDRTSGKLHLSDIRRSQKGLYYPGVIAHPSPPYNYRVAGSDRPVRASRIAARGLRPWRRPVETMEQISA